MCGADTRLIFFPFFLSDKFLSGIFQIILNFRAGAYSFKIIF